MSECKFQVRYNVVYVSSLEDFACARGGFRGEWMHPAVQKESPQRNTERKLHTGSGGCFYSVRIEEDQQVYTTDEVIKYNSVFDGIISGFRKVDGVDMIQFTAPISHGSSGGAVLNMYGEVIGISTAGVDSGQNINLAVGYECIHPFIRGFV